MTSRMIQFRLSLLSVFVASASVMLAQSATDGAVAGTVMDAQGAEVPSALVVLHDNGTAAEQKLAVDAQGYFRIGQLSPGDYSLVVSAPGFGQYRAAHVQVQVGVITELRPAMHVAGETQQVEVSSAGGVVDTETSDFTANINQTAIGWSGQQPGVLCGRAWWHAGGVLYVAGCD